MGKKVNTKGIVISEIPIGESDKRLIVFSKDFGKISVFSKGCKKATSPLLSISQLFSYANFEMIEGKNAYNVTNGELIDSFFLIKENLIASAYGMYFLEFISKFTEEGEKDNQLYELLIRSIYQISSNKLRLDSIKIIFELKALALLGYKVQTSNCGICNNEALIMGIHLENGYACCANCFSRKDSKVFLGNEITLNGISFLQSIELKDLFKQELEPELLFNLSKFSEKFIDIHLGKELKTKSFLKSFQGL